MLARDGVLPAFLGRTHHRFQSPHRAGQLQTVLAALVIAICALLNADPYQQLLIWVNTPGIFGIVGLQGLVSVAAFLYLRRNPDAATHKLMVPLSLASAILLFGVVLLIGINIELLTFADALTNTILILVTPVVFLAGLAAARWVRRRRPETFAQIGSFETHES
jgi:amino acid transporter